MRGAGKIKEGAGAGMVRKTHKAHANQRAFRSLPCFVDEFRMLDVRESRTAAYCAIIPSHIIQRDG